MPVQLDAESEFQILERVTSGAYRDAAEVVRAALEALEEREKREQFEHLRAMVREGFEQAEKGELIEYTPEFREAAIQRARRRAAAGEKPSPDVVP